MKITYNINIERSLLATILFDPRFIHEAKESLHSDEFYLPFHRHVFSAMLELENEDMPIDEEFISKKLNQDNHFDEVAMLDIISTNPLANIKPYIEEIKHKAGLRSLIELSSNIYKQVGEDMKVHEIGENIISFYDTLVDNSLSSKLRETKDFLHSFELEMQKAYENDGVIGLKTGITNLDNLIGGFEPGELVVVAGRPGMGKTAFATSVANYCELNGFSVLFDSLEMDGSKIIRRLIANRANENLSLLKQGVCRDFNTFQKVKDEFRHSHNFILHSLYYPTIEQLTAKARQVFRKTPIKVWIIDHLKHIKTKSSNSYEISNERGEQLKQIIKLCKEYGVVPMMLHQLTRANESRQIKKPNLADLGQSSAIEELAAWVILLYRESYYKARDTKSKEDEIVPAEAIIAKARDGKLGTASCFFCGIHSRFQNDPPITVETRDYSMPLV